MAIASNVTIEIAGNRIPDFLHFTITQRMYQPHEFTLVCRRDAFERPGDVPLSSSIDKIGSVITFSIGGINSGTGNKDFLFKGIITGMSTSESMIHQEIIIKGYSPDILLNGYPVCRTYDNMTLGQVADQVMRPYPQDQISLTGDPDNNSQFPYLVQYNESNYDFLRRLARRFGQWFFYNGRNLVFGSFQKSTINGILGVNLMDFDLNANLAPLKFEFYTPDFITGDIFQVSSSDSDITSDLDTLGKHVHDQSLSSFPESSRYYFPYAFFQPDGSLVPGQPSPVRLEKQSIASRMVVVNGNSNEPLQLGNVFRIKARNTAQNNDTDIGDYLITGLTHTFDNSMNYHCNFKGIPSSVHVSPDANIKAASLCETQSAIVKDNNDPEKLGRIRVSFTWQEDSQMTPWIRMANVHSGSNYGAYFIPEINDEVLVGFEGGNPQNPYIIGPMYNSSAKPDQNWITNSNDIKTLRTRSGHTIEFNDTSGSEELIIYNGDKDSETNKISLSLSDQKITIESTGDLELKGQNIKLEAQGNIELNGSQDINLKTDSGNVKVDSGQGFNAKGNTGVEIKGPQIKIAADARLTVDGAMTEINGTGQVKIAGALVMIN